MSNRNKKILVISNLYPSKSTPFYGSFVKNFEEQLKQDPRTENVKGVYIKGLHDNLAKKLLSYILFYLRIIYCTLFQKYDLVYVHLISHSTLPLRFSSIFRHLPLVFNIHGEDLLVTTSLARKLRDWALPLVKRARFIVVPSNYFKKITEEYLPDYPKEQIIVSASGGVKSLFRPAKKIQDRSRIKIGYVSRIDRGKGWDVFIDAVNTLKGKHDDLQFEIAGGGPEVNVMKERINDSKFPGIMYRGPIAHEDLPEFYQSLDLFVFPTQLRESLGLVGLEAMACGVPVIGSNIGGLTDYIKDGYNGFLFSPGNSKDLADKISEFVALSYNERERLKRGAIETAKKYNDKDVSSKLFNIIL